MKTVFTVFLVFFLSCVQLTLYAQEIFTQNYIDDKVDINIGEKKVVFYSIIGTNQDLINASVEIFAPIGFKILTNTANISSLKIGELKNLFFTIQTGSNTPFGSYKLDIKIHHKDSTLYTKSLLFNVLKNQKIEILVLEKPDKLSQKPQEEISYFVKNAGNTKEHISLKSSSGQVIGITDLNLEPGETTIIKTQNRIPIINQEMRLVSFDLICKVDSLDKPFVSIFTVPILSFNTTKNDPYQRFPILAGLVYNQLNSNNEKIGAVMFDFSGKGFIDKRDKHLVSFIARGPNRFNLPRFGNIDQYFLGYENKKIGVDVGDKLYVLSNLIENGRFSRGIDLKHKIGNLQLSTFYLKPRFFKGINNEYGASVTQTFNPNFKTKLLLIQKNHNLLKSATNTSFLGLGTEFERGKFEGQGELSVSKTGNRYSGGAFLNGKLEFARIKFYSSQLYTGKTYYGFFNNSLQFNNSVFWFLNKKTSIGYSKNISQLNPSLDAYYYLVSPYFDNNNISLSRDLNKKNKLRFNLITGTREDKMEVKSFHFKENLFRYYYEWCPGQINVKFDGDFGNSLNLMKSKDQQTFSDLYRYRTILGYYPVKQRGISLFFEYLNTQRFENINRKSKYWFYGINTQMNFGNLVNLSLNYRNNYAPDELFQSQSFFDTSINLNLGKHQISAMSTYAYLPAPINSKNLFFTLKYTVKINAPLRKKKGLGSVEGYVSGLRKDGVILNLNGRKIMTDPSGKFSFNDLTPGRYYLGADKSSLGQGNVFDAEMPYLVEISPDKRNNINLNVILTGKILGEVIIIKNTEISKENMLIEIFENRFSKITTTDKYGKFQVSELKEGIYQVKILSEHIKKMYDIKNTELFIEVKKGQEIEFQFILEEKKKKINFQKEKFILK